MNGKLRHFPIYVAVTCLAIAILTIPLTAIASSDGVYDVKFANGIQARIFTAEHLERATEMVDDTRGITRLEDGKYLSVITSVEDPVIVNKGDGRFHPFLLDHVVEFVDGIKFPRTNIVVDIYILPYPRSNVLVSAASGSTIYLSPQVLDISREGAAYVIAHELGHVFQSAYMPERARRRWDEYRQLRGISDRDRYSASGRHADRPAEIFAEDFRVLFGGSEAYFGGQIENATLTRPEHVAGLRPFFAKLTAADYGDPFIVGVGNYPNPFNPETELRIELADEFVATGEQVTIRVYDVRGAHVRDLYSAVPNGGDLRVKWDGRDSHGRDVASQTYFAVVRAGEHRFTHKLLMVK